MGMATLRQGSQLSSGPCGGRRLSTDVIFSKTKLCGDEQRNGGVPRDVLDCGGTAALENDSGALWIQSEHDPFLRLSGCAAYCAENWTGEGQGTGSENVMVARGCSRESYKSSRLFPRQTKTTWRHVVLWFLEKCRNIQLRAN